MIKRPVPKEKIPTDWFGQLYDLIMATQIRGDGKTISVKHTPSGAVISVMRGGAGGSGSSAAKDNGMFTIKAQDGGGYIVVDTSDDSQAGIAQINGSFYTCATHSFTASADTYVLLRYTLPLQDGTGGTVDFIEASELPETITEFAYLLIGRITYTDGQASISQDHTTGTAIMWWQGPCWESE